VFECLPDQTCPWVYPVFLINRDQIDFQLKAAGVQLHTFGLHLHSSLFKSEGPLAISDALYLSKNVLCLAIHQDLGELDIDKEIQIIQNIFKSRNFNESESRDRSR
jgi:perosamine synthetase